MDPKQVEDFLVRLAGALTGGLEDAALECYYKAYVDPLRPFPYTEISPNLPPTDDLIVGGLAIPPWVIGYLVEEDGKKRGDSKAQEMGKAAKKFGEGNVCYSLPMVLHGALVRAAKITVPAARVSGQSSERRETPADRYETIVVRL